MAIVFMDGFDSYGDATTSPDLMRKIYAVVGTPSGTSVSNAAPRTGTYSFRLPATFTSSREVLLRRVLGTTVSSGGVAFSVFFPALPVALNRAHRICFLGDATNVNVLAMLIDDLGAIRLYNNATNTGVGTLIASSATGIISANTHHHLELKFLCNGASSTVQVKLDGVDVIASTTVTLTATAYSFWGIQDKQANTAGGTLTYIDDVVMWDTTGSDNNDFLGDVKVATLFPTSNGSEQDFVVGAGASAWEAIDDQGADDDTTYIVSTALNDRSSFNKAALSDAAVVKAVQIQTTAAKDDVGDCELRASIISGGNEAVGTDRVLTTSYLTYADVVERNPNGSVAWTQSTVNAAQIAVERRL